MSQRDLLILGTRGIPAAHGGFETFAERLALYLVTRGWTVGVYCQRDVRKVGQRITCDDWHGIERIHVEVAGRGPRATLDFDWHCVRDAAKRSAVCLVLGYNGAVFLPYLRWAGRPVITNMDGIEWRRPKWNLAVKTWFWLNEWIAAWSSDRLVADHPGIADHVATRRSRDRISTIPYGGDPVDNPSESLLAPYGLEPGRYLVSIARVEPDNNIGLMVEAFSRRKRDARLVVLGDLVPSNPYHRAVRAAAGEEVMFPGGIYNAAVVKALRYHARAYLHGHTVGGTNPSLVEALWAGNAVVAHDNVYNRWTAGDAGLYFDGIDSCETRIHDVLTQDLLVARSKAAALRQAQALFRWDDVLEAYEEEFLELAGIEVPALAPALESSSDLKTRNRP